MKKHLTWFDNHLIELMAGFLLAFLPLYPKWPLFDALPGYIVRIRLEDILILFAVLIFLIQVKRGKAVLRKNPLFWPIVAYLVIGLLSSLSALFITKTVILEPVHVGKLALHWARRVEYMSLAFIFFSAVKSVASLKRIIMVFVITGVLVSLYGFGQKYYEWPVYSTMNREFSKGWRLVLTEHARVSSTFAGHYDLAAFSLVILMFFAALAAVLPRNLRILFFVLFIPMYGTFLLTGSRTSFIAYLVAISLLAALLLKSQHFKKALVFWLVFMVVSWVGVLSYGPMKDRFASLLKLDRLETQLASSVLSKFKFSVPSKSGSQDLDLIYESGDTPPTPVNESNNSGEDLPPDVYESIPESFPEASLSAIPATSGSGNEGKPRTYSQTAETVGLSSAIRFDALWPKAFAGFKRNPLLGTGYATLLKDNVTDFTEAESTDNDYLRALGETGLLGVLSFFGIIVWGIWRAWKYLSIAKDPVLIAFTAAFIAGMIGLMINALYIDVFVSSKVAYTVWALMGLMFGLMSLAKNKKLT